MDLPRWLIGLFDPASREFDRDRRRRGQPRPGRGQAFRGGAVMGPGIPGGSRQATPEELAAMRADARTSRGDFETTLAHVHAEHDEQLHDAARELLRHGRVHVTLASTTLEARLLSFWRGDRILCIDQTALDHPGSEASSMTRFSRHDRPGSVGVIADYLAVSLANSRMNE